MEYLRKRRERCALASLVGRGGSLRMVSWRVGSVVLVLLAMFAACSGKSEGDKDKDDGGHSGGSAGETGDGGTTQVTGAAGEPSDGGGGGNTTASTGTTGSPNVTGTTVTSFTATTSGTTGVVVPTEWHCAAVAYGNGFCDCGCGALDVDCESEELEACDTCNVFGGCNRGPCPGKIDPDDISQCTPPPDGWTCTPEAYFDQTCNCGCGALDADCESEDPSECETCNSTGSCSTGICPGSIDPEDNTSCYLPEGYTCPAYTYGNGLCDCGCGVLDRDCDSASRDECVVCSHGCSNESCPGPIDADDNTICTGVPYAWTCAERFYGDGRLCHCGCGAPDPDCESQDGDACDRCGFEGSCSRQECPGTIDPDNNAACRRPTPPDGWTCDGYLYGDGWSCDCGCGVLDVDCRTDSIDECTTCIACGSYQCPGKVDPDDIRRCTPLPEDWTCAPYLYADGYSCDCGCHAFDPDCESSLPSACTSCSPAGGSCVDNTSCKGLDPEDNSRCVDSAPPEWDCEIETYGDGACDCGCGTRDIDCKDGSIGACEFCDLKGSCSKDKCPGAIDQEDNAVCVE